MISPFERLEDRELDTGDITNYGCLIENLGASFDCPSHCEEIRFSPSLGVTRVTRADYLNGTVIAADWTTSPFEAAENMARYREWERAGNRPLYSPPVTVIDESAERLAAISNYTVGDRYIHQTISNGGSSRFHVYEIVSKSPYLVCVVAFCKAEDYPPLTDDGKIRADLKRQYGAEGHLVSGYQVIAHPMAAPKTKPRE